MGLLAIVALLLLPAQSPAADFVYLVTALLCLVVIFGEALTAPRGARGPWWAFFAFQWLAMAAQAVAAVEAPCGEPAAFPGAVDAISLAAYVPAFVGLVLLIHRLRPGRDRESWIDASILTVTGICVFGLFLIAPAFTAPVGGWAAVVVVALPDPRPRAAQLPHLAPGRPRTAVGRPRPADALVRPDASRRTSAGMPSLAPATRASRCPTGRGSSGSPR